MGEHISNRNSWCPDNPPLQSKTLMRLRRYLTALQWFQGQGLDVVTSRELADYLGLGAAMVRKDLSYIGAMGIRGLGYPVSELQEGIHRWLERRTCLLAWIGAQWLGNFLTTINPSPDLNFCIVAAFDTRPEWVGRKVGPWKVLHLSEIPALFSKGCVQGVVMALPEATEAVAETLTASGVTGVLNITPMALSLPPCVKVRQVDLVGELMALAAEVGALQENPYASGF